MYLNVRGEYGISNLHIPYSDRNGSSSAHRQLIVTGAGTTLSMNKPHGKLKIDVAASGKRIATR
jgi:hypothetical protein